MERSSSAIGQPLPKEAEAAYDIIARELGGSVIGVYLFGSALAGGPIATWTCWQSSASRPATRRADAWSRR